MQENLNHRCAVVYQPSKDIQIPLSYTGVSDDEGKGKDRVRKQHVDQFLIVIDDSLLKRSCIYPIGGNSIHLK